MAQEDEHFDFADVVEGVTAKMIRRHPHVFGDDGARSAGMAKGMWERIKAEEKAERKARRAELGLPEEEKGFLDDVPAAFPALVEAEKLQRRAARVGFDWGAPGPVLAKIREEIGELEKEILSDGDTTLEMEDELGDVLFAVANLARHLDIDPEAALRRTNGKFRRRFAAIETAADAQSTTLEDMTLDEMEKAWQAAKKT
jgi:ATP diphosphatase